MRLHYLDSELNGNTESGLVLWRYDGATWQNAGQSAMDTTNNWVEQSDVTAFSPWALASSTPTAVTLGSLSATSQGALAPVSGAGNERMMLVGRGKRPSPRERVAPRSRAGAIPATRRSGVL